MVLRAGALKSGKPEEGKGTGAICGRAAEASAKEFLRPAQKSDDAWRVPDFCARMGEELRAV